MSADEIAIEVDLGSIRPPPMVDPAVAPTLEAVEPARDSVDAARETPVATAEPRKRSGVLRMFGALLLMGAGAAIGAVFLADTAQPVREVAQRAGVPGLAAEPQTFVPEQAEPEPESPVVVEGPVEPDTDVQITLQPIPPRARIYVNGEPSESPITLPKDGQSHLVVVRRPGYRAWSRRIVADTDETIDIRWIRSRQGRARAMMGLFESSGID